MIEISSLEQHLLLAILRLRPNAYGISLHEELEKRTCKNYSFGSIYAALERIENKGMVTKMEGEPTEKRGGRRKLYFDITAKGQTSLSNSLKALDAMRSGIAVKGALI